MFYIVLVPYDYEDLCRIFLILFLYEILYSRFQLVMHIFFRTAHILLRYTNFFLRFYKKVINYSPNLTSPRQHLCSLKWRYVFDKTEMLEVMILYIFVKASRNVGGAKKNVVCTRKNMRGQMKTWKKIHIKI